MKLNWDDDALMKKGSVLIRDARLRHCGMPNRSDQIRHMIAMDHQVSWFSRTHTLSFQKRAESVFDSNFLGSNANFIDEIPDYIFGTHFPHS